jgi:DNA-directed RNA polymerase specialized sigma24 family protein
VVEPVFARLYCAGSRAAAVRAAMIVNAYRLPKDFRRDLTQEALLELWRRRTAYDPSRGSERTFTERVIANRMTSVVRSMHSARSGQFRETPFDNVPGLIAPTDSDLRLDVWCVLARTSYFDRRVAVCLIEQSPTETSRGLGVSRAAVYRAIGRLRVAFTASGFGNRRSGANTVRRPNCDMRIGVRQQEVRQ